MYLDNLGINLFGILLQKRKKEKKKKLDENNLHITFFNKPSTYL
mgnify:CR=1 FL=1